MNSLARGVIYGPQNTGPGRCARTTRWPGFSGVSGAEKKSLRLGRGKSPRPPNSDAPEIANLTDGFSRGTVAAAWKAGYPAVSARPLRDTQAGAIVTVRRLMVQITRKGQAARPANHHSRGSVRPATNTIASHAHHSRVTPGGGLTIAAPWHLWGMT